MSLKELYFNQAINSTLSWSNTYDNDGGDRYNDCAYENYSNGAYDNYSDN